MSVIESHIKIKIECQQCEKMFASKSGLNRHVNEFHLQIKRKVADDNIVFTCDICLKTFK